MCGDIFISTLRGCAHNSNFDAKELIMFFCNALHKGSDFHCAIEQLASNTSLGSFFIHMELNVLCVSVYSLKLFSMAPIVRLFGICSLLLSPVAMWEIQATMLLTMLSVI